MSNFSKSQKLKLTNSRKRFKELQELKKKKIQNVVENSQKHQHELPSVDIVAGSNCSSTNTFSGSLNNMPELSNFDRITDDISHPSTALFFENVVEEGYTKSKIKDNICQGIDNIPNSCQDQATDIESCKTEYLSEIGDQESVSLLCQDYVVPHTTEEQQVFHTHNNLSSLQLDQQPKVTQESITEKVLNTNKSVYTANQTGQIHQTNVNSLKQPSSQIAQHVNSQLCSLGSIDCDHSSDLEKRNLELNMMLNQEKSNNLMNELQDQVIYSEELNGDKTDMLKNPLDFKINKFQEQLQSHLQTIGMLVAEKTELSGNLNKLEIYSKQKTAECEELETRLKASKSRIVQLEREISNYKMEKHQNEKSLQQNNALIITLQQDCLLFKEQKDALMQDLLEMKEELKNSSEENLKLQRLHHELSGKFALADIKLQQITATDQQQIESDLKKITEENFQLEKQLGDMKQLLNTITKERDECVLQYQQYVHQQNAQVSNLTKKLEQLQLENEKLTVREQSRIRHIGELEKQLQSIQNEQVTLATERSSHKSESDFGFENVRELCVQLEMEKIALEENYTKVSNEKDMLLKELEAKNDSLSQLEGLVEQLQGNQPDSVKILATMESDKIAAARAVQQNKDLKQHIESLEEVFLKLVREV